MTGQHVTPRLGFNKAHKLRAAGEFERARKTGRRIGDAFFGILYAANDQGQARLGMAVAVRTAGGAVRRNRIRRIVRESFRQQREQLPAVDIVVNARAAAKEASNQQLFASLKQLWGKVERR